MPDPRVSHRECISKYAVALPEGAIHPKPLAPMRIRPPVRQTYSAYACVAVTIDEAGVVTDARVVETDSKEFGEYFLNLVKHTVFSPATLNGKPFTTTTVISAGYG